MSIRRDMYVKILNPDIIDVSIDYRVHHSNDVWRWAFEKNCISNQNSCFLGNSAYKC